MRASETRVRALLVAIAAPALLSVGFEPASFAPIGTSQTAEARATNAVRVPAPKPTSASLPEPAPSEARPDVPGKTPAIENAAALAPFFAALDRTARGEGRTRVTHLGDSSIGSDALPHALRTALASRFGEGGPGYVYLARESPSYDNRTVVLRNDDAPWDVCVMIRRCERDAHYGLAGVSFESRGGARTRIDPSGDRTVSRAELWYLAQPNGGRIGFALGEGPETVIDTRADRLESRWHVLERASGRHRVVVRALGGGPIRAFGVVLERDEAGVVWDALGVVGAFTHRVLAQDEAHFAEQLAHRAPDLVVLSYGGNDLRRLIFGHVDPSGLEDETHRVLARVRAAVPGAACLVMGISDHARSGSARVERDDVAAVLAAQRSAARHAGCAFWDTTRAMGGPGSLARWRRQGLAAGDGKHLNERGRRVIAARLERALEAARQTQPRVR